MNSIIADLSKLTLTPKETLQHYVDLSIDCLSFGAGESLSNGEQTYTADIGLGTISILILEDCVKYKFIPSKQFMDAIETSLKGESPLLERRIEDRLSKKILTAYKELL